MKRALILLLMGMIIKCVGWLLFVTRTLASRCQCPWPQGCGKAEDQRFWCGCPQTDPLDPLDSPASPTTSGSIIQVWQVICVLRALSLSPWLAFPSHTSHVDECIPGAGDIT